MTPDLLWDWLIPSLVGYALGYLTCLLVRRAVEEEDSPRPEAQRRGQLARTIFGIILLILATFTFVQSYLATTCIRNGIIERSEANGRETQAQIELFQAILDDDPTNNRAAQAEYLAAVRELERVRSANPLDCR